MDLSTVELFVLAMGAMGLGILLLIKGGDWTVDSAVYIATRFGISPLVVGFTIVAIGTSLPEFVVSMVANFQGSGGIAIGNVLGSNIANILMVIGLTGFFVTLQTHAQGVIKDLVFMLIATGIMTFLLLQEGDIGRVAGLGMVILLLSYIFLQYKMSLRGEIPAENEEPEESSFTHPWQPYLFLLLGLIAVAGGAEFLVRGAKVSARLLEVPEAVIALSIIAFGTSLPELSTCIIAARKGFSEIVLGNIIGSNVFNILMIIGLTAIIKPIAENSYEQQLVDFDIWVVVAVSVIFSLILIFYNKITRPIGIVFMALYALYNIYLYTM